MPYRQLAKEIGIGCPTLMDFLDSKRPPRFVTMAKIAKFIEDNRKVWDKEKDRIATANKKDEL